MERRPARIARASREPPRLYTIIIVTHNMQRVARVSDQVEQGVAADRAINEHRWRAEELALLLIVTQVPMAKDRRMIAAAIHIITDLERMADHAVIARIAIQTASQSPLKPLVDIPRMTEIARGMLNDTVTAYIVDDPVAAHAIAARIRPYHVSTDEARSFHPRAILALLDQRADLVIWHAVLQARLIGQLHRLEGDSQAELNLLGHEPGDSDGDLLAELLSQVELGGMGRLVLPDPGTRPAVGHLGLDELDPAAQGMRDHGVAGLVDDERRNPRRDAGRTNVDGDPPKFARVCNTLYAVETDPSKRSRAE